MLKAWKEANDETCGAFHSRDGIGRLQKALSPELLREYQSKTLYTCCNIHYEHEGVSDANYYVGATVPFASPVRVEGAGRGSITFTAGAQKLTLSHAYGTEQESFQQYVDKILVPDDPTPKVANFPEAVQRAIRESRVEVGMTKEQVLVSLGYPPTHRTASTTQNEWTYWYNRWVTYRVVFDEAGRVSNIVGSPAPTRNQPIEPEEKPAAKPVPGPARKKGR